MPNGGRAQTARTSAGASFDADASNATFRTNKSFCLRAGATEPEVPDGKWFKQFLRPDRLRRRRTRQNLFETR